MKNKASIPLMIVAIAMISLLLSFENIKSAWAITIIETVIDATLTNIPCVGYKSNLDVTLFFDGTDTEVEFMNANTGAFIATTNVADTCVGTTTSTTDLPSNGIACLPTGNNCYYALLESGTSFRLAIVNVATKVVTIYSTTGTTFDGCRLNGLTFGGGSTLKGVMSNCNNAALDGLYTVSVGLIGSGVSDTSILIQRDNTTPSNGLSSSCYDSTTGKVVFGYATGASSGGFRIISTTNGVTFVDATDDIDQVTCGEGFSIGVGDGADNMNVLNLSSDSITGVTTATNGHVAMKHANTVLVTSTTSTSISLFTWSATTSMTNVGSLSGFDNSGTLLRGNATRIEAAGITGTTASHYVISDLENTGEEEEEPQLGQENGVCLNVDANGDGRVNVLDCVGSVTAFEGFTSGQNATDVTATITDGLGLTNCGDNADHETCGSGLFMFIFMLLIFEGLSLALYLGLTGKLNADRQIIDIMLIMLMIGFATLALAFYLNWIPDIVFYAIIVLIAGFLTFGLVSKFRGG